MKTSLSFFVPGQPIAQPRHRVPRSGGHAYIARLKSGQPHPIHAWKELIALTAKQEEWDIVKKPDGVLLELIFYMKRPKGNKLMYHITKPDRDNLQKAVADAMEGIMYENDSQIIDGSIRKIYATVEETTEYNYGPGVFINIWRRVNEKI